MEELLAVNISQLPNPPPLEMFQSDLPFLLLVETLVLLVKELPATV